MTKCLTRKYDIFNYKSHNNEQCRRLNTLVFTYSISIKKSDHLYLYGYFLQYSALFNAVIITLVR